MSIVIAYANEKRVIVKSDGRECDIETGKVVSEDTLKIKSIGNNCLIGFTGNKQYCENAIEIFNTILKGQNPFSNIKIFQELLQQSYSIKKCNAYFIVAGNYKGKILLWYLSWEDGFKNIEDSSPSIENPEKYVTTGCREINTAIPFCDFVNSSLTIENNMNNYIRYIATLSHDVNDHITTRKIELK